jgi:hypothetical protein
MQFIRRSSKALTSACILLVIMLSCSDETAFKKAYSSVDRSRGVEKLIADLVRIDQEYPDRFTLKHEIGMLHLQRGDPISAEPYLKRAETLAGTKISASERATLFGGLAIASYAHGEYAKAEEYGRKALAVKADEAAAFGFITGRALIGERKDKEALELFDAAWAKARAAMVKEDYRAYARALDATGRNADLVAVLDSYEASYPYEPGSGLMQSAAYERLGDFDASVYAAFKEAEYGRAFGAMAAPDILKNLAAIGRKLDDRTFNPAGKGEFALEVVSAFARDDWAVVVGLLEKRGSTGPFEKYLLLSAKIESAHASHADMDAYVALLPSMRSLPPYFHRLYLGLATFRNTSPDRLAEILETSINLAPRSATARKYRGDLADLLGLPRSDGALLLTQAELSAAADKAAATGESALLHPLIATLELKDNRLTLTAVGILRAFAKDARHRPFLIDASKAAMGRTKERLTYILAD